MRRKSNSARYFQERRNIGLERHEISEQVSQFDRVESQANSGIVQCNFVVNRVLSEPKSKLV
jgi:hypothetical protein